MALSGVRRALHLSHDDLRWYNLPQECKWKFLVSIRIRFPDGGFVFLFQPRLPLLVQRVQLIKLLVIHLTNGTPLISSTLDALCFEVGADLLMLQPRHACLLIDYLDDSSVWVEVLSGGKFGEALHAVFKVGNEVLADFLWPEVCLLATCNRRRDLEPGALADIRVRNYSQRLFASSMSL